MAIIIEALLEEILGEPKEFAPITKILLSELQDLKDDWHLHDEDLAHIGDRFLGHEIEQDHLDRENATKDAISCLQTRLASTMTKLAQLKSTELISTRVIMRRS
jgi:hypothetical protein